MHATDDSDALVVEQHVHSNPAEVFAAFTVPSRLLRWWGDPSKWWLTSAEVEPCPGGRYWLHWENVTGEKDEMGGHFKSFAPGKGFVLAFIGSHAKDHTDEVSIELQRESDGTKVVLRHSGLRGRPELHADYQQGWTLILSWLARQY
jgi:uncharacterized protein YndB with AHSA1/START domain